MLNTKLIYFKNMSFFIANCKELEMGDARKGYLKWNSDPKKPYNPLEFIQLWHTSDGSGKVILRDDSPKVLEAGKTYLFFPNDIKQTFCENYMKQFYVDFRIEGMPLPVQDLFEFKKEIDNSPLIYSLLSVINDNLYTNHHKVNDIFLIESALKTILCQFIVAPKSILFSTDNFAGVISFIENNYQSKLTLDELSGVAGYSKGHFATLFKKTFGMSVMRFVEDKRINAAQNFLIRENKSIGEIASITGFKDRLYFSKVFRKKIGVSPSQYRNEMRTHREYNT